jgi:hypothetical protein
MSNTDTTTATKEPDMTHPAITAASLAAVAAKAADDYLDEAIDAGVEWDSFTAALADFGLDLSNLARLVDWFDDPSYGANVTHGTDGLTVDRAAFRAAAEAAAAEYVAESEHDGTADWPSTAAAVEDFGLYVHHGATDATWGHLPATPTA